MSSITRGAAASVASKHVCLRGLWLQEALVDGKLELEKVDIAIPPTCARKRCLEIGFESCVDWPECTYAAVKETWVTTLTVGI